MTSPSFWDAPQEAQRINRKLTALRNRVDRFTELYREYEDIRTLWELGMEEGEEELDREVKAGLQLVEGKLQEMELEVLLSGTYDSHHAIVSLHAGAGGTESQDWVQMLLRMYTRWAERQGFEVELLDKLPGDEAGIKSVTFIVRGEYAYG